MNKHIFGRAFKEQDSTSRALPIRFRYRKPRSPRDMPSGVVATESNQHILTASIQLVRRRCTPNFRPLLLETRCMGQATSSNLPSRLVVSSKENPQKDFLLRTSLSGRQSNASAQVPLLRKLLTHLRCADGGLFPQDLFPASELVRLAEAGRLTRHLQPSAKGQPFGLGKPAPRLFWQRGRWRSALQQCRKYKGCKTSARISVGESRGGADTHICQVEMMYPF